MKVQDPLARLLAVLALICGLTVVTNVVTPQPAATTGSVPGVTPRANAAAMASEIVDRLPDLRMQPLSEFHQGTVKGRRVIRFSATVVNFGDGPFELLGTRPDKHSPMSVTQGIYNNAGGSRKVKTNAVMKYAVADGHHHWHVLQFEHYQISKINGNPIGRDHKEGYCFRDGRRLQGKEPVVYRHCGKQADVKIKTGMSVGWADKYSWKIFGQYIDVQGLSPDVYCVSATADPFHQFVEKDSKNNRVSTRVRLKRDSISVLGDTC